MLWSTESIQKLLDLYLENRELWDSKHAGFADKVVREKALQRIAAQLGVPNVTSEDVNRKYRSMRAAYRVEVRNINTAKVRGFFYKPTLHWFSMFKEYMKKIEAIRFKSCDMRKQLVLQGGLTQSNQYVFTLKDGERPMGPINNSLPPEVHLKQTNVEEELPEDELSSEESEDEFQSFADHIAEQLRSISVHRAVMIQNQIQRLFANDKEIHDDYNEDELEEMAVV